MSTTFDAPSTSASRSTDFSREQAPRRRRSFRWIWKLALLLGVLAVVGTAATVWTQGGLHSQSPRRDVLTHTVSRGELLVTVTVDGNVESAQNVDVKCEVAGGSTILWIVPDGELVEKGDELVRLDESTIQEQLDTQRITFEKAKAAMIQAQEDYEAAKIAVNEYLEGTYVQLLTDIEAQITIAKENLSAAENLLDHTQKMARKGYVTPLQLEAQKFAVKRSKLELGSAETAKIVLERFTRVKMRKQLEAARDAAAARMRSEQAAFELEKGRMERLEEQLSHCVIKAPKSGMVVYANEVDRHGRTELQIEEGAVVRERQVMIRLPDLSRMQAKVAVHESKIDQVKPGLPARVTVQGRTFDGQVVSIANQPQPGGWLSSSVKEYTTVVAIEDATENLKPGMTATVEILIAELEDVLSAPWQCVVEQDGRDYCWVQTSEGPQRRLLELGAMNDKFVEIKDGVLEGEAVIQNPRAVVPEASTEPSAGKAGTEGKKAEGKKRPGRRGDGKKRNAASSPSRDSDRSESRPSEAERQGGETKKNSAGRGGNPLKQFDADGDGKLSRDEAPERMKSFFDRLDKNGDGFVDAAELSAMRRRAGGRRSGDAPSGASRNP